MKGLLGFIGRKIITKTATLIDDKILDVILSHVKPLMLVIGLQVALREMLKDPPPAVYFTATNEYSIQFALVGQVKEFGRQFATETTLREEAYLAFRKEGIEVPLPQRVVQMKTDS